MTTSSFISAIENGTAQVLTVTAAKSLIGKKIAWMYSGYQGNDNSVKESVIGRIVSEWDYYSEQPMEGYSSRADFWNTHMSPSRIEAAKQKLLILDEQGELTYMYSHSDFFEEPTFVCSDNDREVYFILL